MLINCTGICSAYYEEEQLRLITTAPQLQPQIPELNMTYVERGSCSDASFSVIGMKCCKCVRKVRTTLMDVLGVEGVHVYLREKRVDVFFHQRNEILHAITTALSSLNFKISLMNRSTIGWYHYTHTVIATVTRLFGSHPFWSFETIKRSELTPQWLLDI